MSEPEPIDLSKLQNIQFGPSWAEGLAGADRPGEVVWGKIPGGSRERDDRPPFRGGRGFDRGGPRPGGPGGGGPGQRPGGSDRRGPRPDFRGGGPGQGDRRPPFQGREGQGPPPPRGDRGPRPGGPERREFSGPPRGDDRGRPPFRGGDRRDFRGGHGHSHQDFRDAPPILQGWQVRLIPDHRHVEAIARQIKASGRAFSVFDVGRLFMESRDRYLLRFSRFTAAPQPQQPQPQGEGKPAPQPPRANPGPEELYQCKADHSLWLSRDEAIRHLLHSPALTKYYRTETVTTEAPKGNWNSIAVCGFSGALLGPPNHHDFQRNVARLHRERFSDMSLERYKSRIRTEKDETLLQKWQEQQSTVMQYVPVTAEEPAPAPVPAADPAPAPAAAADPDTAPAAEGEAQSEGEGEVPAETVAETVPTKEAPAALKSVAEMEAHFLKHHAQDAVKAVTRPTVPGSIPGKCLAPPLIGLVRREVESQQRFPMQLVQDLCRDLEGQGLRFFKRDRKTTFVCRNRPHFLPDDLVLSDRIRAMVEMVRANPGITYSRLVSTLAPHIVVSAESSTAPSPEAAPATETPAETAAPADSNQSNVTPAVETPQPEEPKGDETPAAETVTEAIPETETDETPAVTETTGETEASPVAEVSPVQTEEETAPSAEQPESTGESSAPAPAETPAPAPAPAAPALSPEEIVILQDLHWLVQEGYVTEFQNGELFVLGRPPQPPMEKKPRPPKPPRPAAAPRAAAPGDQAGAEKDPSAEAPPAEVTAESAPGAAEEPSPEVPVIEEVSASSAFDGEASAEATSARVETAPSEDKKPASSPPEAS